MAQLRPGQQANPFALPSIDGSTVDLGNLGGKRALIAFMRFAACPFCKLRLHQLVQRHEELGRDFKVVVIFDSPLDHLQRHTSGHQAPFPVLADEGNMAYKAYGIQHSIAGVMKGMLFRIPSLLKAMFVHGYLPTSFRGSLTTMPADFLVDEAGKIHTAYYGMDEGDHLPFDVIKGFAVGSKPEPPAFGR